MTLLSFPLSFISLYLLQATTILALQNPHNNGKRIIDGTDSAKLYYHACSITMVDLKSSTIHFGGGSIISETHVLTTAALVSR